MSPYIWFVLGLVATPIGALAVHVWFGNGLVTTLVTIAYLIGIFWNLRVDLRKKKEKRQRDTPAAPPLTQGSPGGAILFTPAAAPVSDVDEMERLASLVERGFLTREEFDAEKERRLRGAASQLPASQETAHSVAPVPEQEAGQPQQQNGQGSVFSEFLRGFIEGLASPQQRNEQDNVAKVWTNPALSRPCPVCIAEAGESCVDVEGAAIPFCEERLG